MKTYFLRALFEAQSHEEGTNSPSDPTTDEEGIGILSEKEEESLPSPQRATRRDTVMLTSATTMTATIATLSASQALDKARTEQPLSLKQVTEEDFHGKVVSLLMLDEFYEGGWGIKWHLAAWEHISSRDGIYSYLSSLFTDLTGKGQRTFQIFVKDHINFFKPSHLAYCMFKLSLVILTVKFLMWSITKCFIKCN